MSELILEGKTIESPMTYGIGYDPKAGILLIYRQGMPVASLSRAQTRTLEVEVMQKLALTSTTESK